MATRISLKLVYGDKIHRVKENPSTFVQLRDLATQLIGAGPFDFSYKDDEGDQVGIANDAHLQEAYEVTRGMGLNILRVTIQKAEVDSEFVIYTEALKTEQAGVEIGQAEVQDGCNSRPIVGLRYKCAVCPDFDFCSRCEATIAHPHPFLKIKDPSQTPIAIQCMLHEGEQQEEVEQPQIPQRQSGPQPMFRGSHPPPPPFGHQGFQRPPPYGPQHSYPPPPPHAFHPYGPPHHGPHHGPQHGPHYGPPHCWRRQHPRFQNQEQGCGWGHRWWNKFAQNFWPQEEQPKLKCKFLKNLDTPDAILALPGTTVVKTWRVQNAGNIPWPQNCILILTKGTLTGDQEVIPPLQPGQEGDISIKINVPNEAGDHSASWKLMTPDGNEFGCKLFAKLNVSEEALANATRLIEMGFSDKEANMQLIRQFNGDIDKVIQALLKAQHDLKN